MKNFKLLINPFERIPESKLIFIGFIFFVFGSLIAYLFNSRFDNFLHIIPVSNIKFYQPFLDNLLILICLSFFLFVAGIILYSKTRPVDILATALIGNAPFYLISLTNIKDYSLKASQELLSLDLQSPSISSNTIIYFTIVGVISILILIWIIALLYNGFKTAANAKGVKAVLFFILALLLTTAVTSFIPLTY